MRRSGSGFQVPGSGFGSVVRGSRFVVLLTVVLIAVAIPSRAQVAPVVPASMPRVEFDAAIRQALEKNPTVAQAAVAVTRAEALLQQARAFALPSLNAGVTNT